MREDLEAALEARRKAEIMLEIRTAAFRATLTEHSALQDKHEKLLSEWNKLVTLINAKGGQRFLDCATIPGHKKSTRAKLQFTAKEIMQLIKLCHPDKHAGSEEANEITKKLLSLRS